MKAKKETRTATKHTGVVKKPLKFSALVVEQGAVKLYVFVAKASVLYGSFSINRRVEAKDKDEGYQRILSLARVDAITNYQ
jgi:hypothetical protein